MAEQGSELDRLARVLQEGAELTALAASGDDVALVVRRLAEGVLEARTEADVASGDVLTVRASDGSDVWFLQLVASAVSCTPSERLLSLRLAACLPVRSERWMERVPLDAPVCVRRADGRDHDGWLRDVSPLGARLTLPGGARPGETLDVLLGAGEASEIALRLRVIRVGAPVAGGVDVAGEVVALAQADWVRLERLLEQHAR